jgi:hypothetical protein
VVTFHWDGPGAQSASEEHPCSGQITRGAEQDVDDLTALVYRREQIPPPPRDLHTSPVEPPVTWCLPARSSSLDELGSEALHPPKATDVIHRAPALGEQLLHVAAGQAVPQIPAHATTITSGGNRKPANAEDEPDELTGSVSQGRPLAQRNRAATTVFLSVRTVESYLGRIYRKLDPRSRTELSRAVEAISRSESDS